MAELKKYSHFDSEMCKTIFKILLFSDEAIAALVAACATAFRNLNTLQGNFNAFIEILSKDVITELIARRNELHTAILPFGLFQDFLGSKLKIDLHAYLEKQYPSFILFQKFRWDHAPRDPQILEKPPEEIKKESLTTATKCPVSFATIPYTFYFRAEEEFKLAPQQAQLTASLVDTAQPTHQG